MKKALTIYIDDDAELTNLCGGFVTWAGNKNSVTFLNEKVPKEAEGFYLPMKADGKKCTQWVINEELVFSEVNK